MRRARGGGHAGALPETCGDAARYADPFDHDDIADQVRAALGDDALARRRAAPRGALQLGAHGRRARRAPERRLTRRILDRAMEQQSAALRAMNDAVLAIAAEATIEPMLQRLAHAARGLVDARYAAIGVPDGEGGFAQFITSGMSDELIAAMGPLPRQHGLLGAMLTSPVPYRTNDVRRDPRFRGWWPSAHPQMRSFLGVPIVAASGIVGALYLTDKVGADEFDEADQQLIEMLSVHAALAIEKADLYERSRELSIVEERNRLARELHDSVTQKLFGADATAEAAATVVDRDPGEAKASCGACRSSRARRWRSCAR